MATMLASRPSTIGRVLDQSLQLFRVSVRGVLPFTVIGAVGTLIVGLLFPADTQSFGVLVRAPAHVPRIGVFGWITTVVTIVIACLAGCAMVHRMAALSAGSGSTRESILVALKRAPILLVGSLLLIAVIIAGVGALVIAGFILGLLLGSGVVPFVIAAGALVLLPLLAVRLSYFYPELILRDAGPAGALESSWRMTRGQFWRLTMLFGIAAGISIALYAGLGFGAKALAAAVVRQGAAPVSAANVAVAVTSALTQLFGGPFWTSVLLASRHDLLMRAEGWDLIAKIAALPPRA